MPHSEPAASTGSLEAAIKSEPNRVRRFLKVPGPGLITVASDDDPSGIGTYAIAGAWDSPHMDAVADLPGDDIGPIHLRQDRHGDGRGPIGVLRRHYSRELLYGTIVALIIANTINAVTDIGTIAAAINMFVPISIGALIVPIALTILGRQVLGSYRLIAKTFKMANSRVVCLYCIGSSCPARMDRGSEGHICVPTFRLMRPFYRRLSRFWERQSLPTSSFGKQVKRLKRK